MAKDTSKPNGLNSGPPKIKTLTPVKPNNNEDNSHNKATLPKVRLDANNDERFFREAQRAIAQPRKPTKASPPLATKQQRPNKLSGPRLGKGAVMREQRRKPKYRLNPTVKKVLNIGAFVVIAGVLLIMLVVRVFSFNALAIFLDDQHIGYMRLDRELTSEQFHNYAIAHIEASLRTSVIVEETVRIAPARWVSGRDIATRDEMLRTLSQGFTYQIVARAIYVNDRLEVMVRTESCVAEIIRFKEERWITSNTISSGFLADWRVEPVIVDPETTNLLSPRDAAEHMDRQVPWDIEYIVQPGDQLGFIALRFDTTADSIALVNNISLDTIINPGESLIIRTRQPLLSVRTVDEHITLEQLDWETETRENPYMAAAAVVFIQYGQFGEQRVVRHVVRIDGVIVDEYVVDAVEISAPVTEIREVGTRIP